MFWNKISEWKSAACITKRKIKKTVDFSIYNNEKVIFVKDK